MILKASQRGGATQLAVHLQRLDENDHVELHEVRGFVADDLQGAFSEAYAVSKGTKCQQFLFSLSLSPPQTADVPIAVFEKAIGEIEAKVGLDGQPRVIVFHEKQGRRHAHCVWSRIDAGTMKAINLPHFKLKLRDASRELFIEHGWHMPAGLVKSAERDPRNFTQTEWQEAKRAGHNPAALKEIFQDCWAISDSRKAFAQALATRGFYLARGDRRGFVAVNTKGEVLAIARWVGLKTKVVEARLGNPNELSSVEETKAYIADLLSGTLGRHLAEAEQQHFNSRQTLVARKMALRALQRIDRVALRDQQTWRSDAEAVQRAKRFRTGLRGLWDRLIGHYARTRHENTADVLRCRQRDERQRQTMIAAQLFERRQLQATLAEKEREHRAILAGIHRDLAGTHRELVGTVPPRHRQEKEMLGPSFR